MKRDLFCKMSSNYKCIGVPMTDLPRPSTRDKYSAIGSSLSGKQCMPIMDESKIFSRFKSIDEVGY